MREVEKLAVLRITEQGKAIVEDMVATEYNIDIFLNGNKIITLPCSPLNLDYLAVGHLFYRGLIHSKEEVRGIVCNEKKGFVKIETQKNVVDPSKHASTSGDVNKFSSDVKKLKIQSSINISPDKIFAMMEEFNQRSGYFKSTGCFHSAALYNTGGILIFTEDISRHNTIDKIFGECLLKDVITDNHLIFTSSRVFSDILIKVAQRNIPILVSKSAPTTLAIKLAKDLGVTLIGFVRGNSLNVYAGDYRVLSNGDCQDHSKS
ncbi:MAG: formate dehydrogenase accessory sulfurtransferase FdhD [Dehalococcoidales bacterium]|nr:formate dehydrogenase accessory sulfurtransferase FdhD [Dehalococcoidales bacterium]